MIGKRDKKRNVFRRRKAAEEKDRLDPKDENPALAPSFA